MGYEMGVEKVVIVGGVAGGASAAARLRRLDENVEIVLFEKGDYISFANCGLPYYIGGTIEKKSDLLLQTPRSFNSRFKVDVRVLSEVIGIDRENKKVKVRNLQDNSEYEESYDKLILSPGAEPIRPKIEGIDSDKVFTLRNVPDTYKIKDYIDKSGAKKAVVVGGGYIGVEMAENLRDAGLYVVLVEMQNQILAPFDYDMACLLHDEMVKSGVELMLSTSVEGIIDKGSNLEVKTSKGIVEADMVIMSAGVKPESKIAVEAGLEVNKRGGIIVNEYMETSDSDIYCAGDAVQVTDYITGEETQIPLAGPANKQGRITADNICGLKSRYEGTQGSAIIKVFGYTGASTGINERTAKRLGLNYDKVVTILANHATYYPGAEYMTIKLIYEKGSGKVLGAQIVGKSGVDKRCDVISTAIRFGGKIEDLTRLELCYAPPYSSAKDPVNMTGYTAENVEKGLVKQFHWHDVEKLARDGSIQLVDTRTRFEYNLGHIEGFINIPVDKLRDRIEELDKSKPVYIACQVGIRGYVACRILSGLGYDSYNLSGGYEFYSSVMNGMI